MRLPLGLLPLALAAAAFAQNQPAPPNVDQESQDPTRRARVEREAAAAAAAAGKTAPLPEPTFADVLKAPDDVALNERFARAQIARGDLRGASTTLERVLMVAPARQRARLLYGVVLMRLDDLAEAEVALKAVVAAPGVPPDAAEQARQYLEQLEARRRLTHFDARVSVGFGVDDNRNAAPDGDARLLFGAPVALSDDSTRKADTNLQFIGSLGATRKLAGPRGHELFARFTYFRSEQRVVDLLNLQAYSPKIGATFRTRWVELTPSLSYDHVLLSQSTYLRSRNAGLRASRRLSRRWEAYAELGHQYQDFVNTPRVTTAGERTGDQLDLTGGANWAPTSTDRLTGWVGHRRKFAQRVFNAYRRESAGVDYLRLLGKGRFLLLSVSGQFDRYEQPDPSVAAIVRSDDAARAQLLYGMPLSLLWKPLDPLQASLGLEVFKQSSTLPNYDYSNDTLTFLVSYRWGI